MVAHIHSFPSPRFEFIDPLAGEAWDQNVAPLPDHTVFHRAAWARVLAETYGHRPFYLRFFDDEGTAALVPLMEVDSTVTGRRGVSLPFADFAGPLWTGPERPGIYQVLLDLWAERKWRHLEIRGGPAPEAGARTYHVYDAHELDLAPVTLRADRFLPAATRRAIHKAERSGLSASVETGAESLEDFYQLHGRTRRRHGLPPQPVGVFRSIGRHVLDAGLGVVVMARVGGKAVAGAVFFHSGRRAVYKFGASECASWGLRPNHLVIWRAIRHFAEAGCESLHFGRTSCDDAGLRRFKHSWGCPAETLRYFRYQESIMKWIENDRPPADSHPLVFGHLPVALNRIVGRIIYPHLD